MHAVGEFEHGAVPEHMARSPMSCTAIGSASRTRCLLSSQPSPEKRPSAQP